ncbi:MAG: methyltransferase domain-containing protein [Pseudomonadales bacterium]|nr:methyltransferase domain-containing protein [Pseudomonadales bacterium]
MALPRLFKQRDKKTPIDVKIQLDEWFGTRMGERVLNEERVLLDQVLPSLFGYHLLQAGVAVPHEWLNSSTVSHKFRVSPVKQECSEISQVRANLDALPIETDSVDVALLHHSLDFELDVHQILRETARVVMPGGTMVVVGFNPWSLWGVWRFLTLKFRRSPWSSRFVSPFKLSDWLNLLDFEVEGSETTLYFPPFMSESLLQRFSGVEQLANMWLRHFGAVYILVAKKRVSCVTPIRPRWRPKRPFVTVPVAQPQRKGKH